MLNPLMNLVHAWKKHGLIKQVIMAYFLLEKLCNYLIKSQLSS